MNEVQKCGGILYLLASSCLTIFWPILVKRASEDLYAAQVECFSVSAAANNQRLKSTYLGYPYWFYPGFVLRFMVN